MRTIFSFVLLFTIDIFFRRAVLTKLFVVRFSYKHCKSSHVCLLAKMTSKTFSETSEKGRDESFQVLAKEPLGTESHRPISKNSSACRFLIGHKKIFVLLSPIGKQFLLSSFFLSSYTMALVSITACLAHAPKKCMQLGNFQFGIKSPSDFKTEYYLPGTIDAFPN